MAKWGEGDPRWIVEERPDATNVNNWHWTEKNATQWSKDRLHELFKDLRIEQNNVVCTVEAIEKCTGEATANNRKGKLIFFYEWELVLKWTGQLAGSDQAHNGKITIPNLSEENDLDEVEITVTIDESNEQSETLKQFMYHSGRDRIREQLGVYIKELKEEYSKNLILPKKGSAGADNDNGAPAPQPPPPTANKANALSSNANRLNAKNAKAATTTDSGTQSVGCKLDVRTLNMTKEFHCRANDLYNALTKPEMLTAFTRSPAKAEPIRGGEFVLYDGNVQGKFEELIPEKKIAQSWRLKNWPSGHYSTVVISLEETQNSTLMTLEQSGIPANEFDAMLNNWHRYYWRSINETFGFGSSIAYAL